eukprot:GEMP01074294.1.p1 GENE.GEMP01074294.1~~GEMP01074294.1.p1  ORF type:complete len:126 (+),score=12.87 GEMP01074294.1:60-437(+)
MDVELLQKSFFLRFMHVVSWVLSAFLTAIVLVAVAYQLFALYIPYTIARFTDDSSYRFPAYFYRVWGEDAKYLTYEHWGYLFAAVGSGIFSVIVVLPDHPLRARSRSRRSSNTRRTTSTSNKKEQ